MNTVGDSWHYPCDQCYPWFNVFFASVALKLASSWAFELFAFFLRPVDLLLSQSAPLRLNNPMWTSEAAVATRSTGPKQAAEAGRLNRGKEMTMFSTIVRKASRGLALIGLAILPAAMIGCDKDAVQSFTAGDVHAARGASEVGKSARQMWYFYKF